MDNMKNITCSFVLDRDIYNAYKSVVSRNGENVKGNLVRYMLDVIKTNTPNAETIAAIREVEEMKKDMSSVKTYNSFSEILMELENE